MIQTSTAKHAWNWRAYSTVRLPIRGVSGYSEFIYAWGRFNLSTSPPTLVASVLGCNETIDIVDVDTTFFGADLVIEPASPPTPLEHTACLSNYTVVIPDHV